MASREEILSKEGAFTRALVENPDFTNEEIADLYLKEEITPWADDSEPLDRVLRSAKIVDAMLETELAEKFKTAHSSGEDITVPEALNALANTGQAENPHITPSPRAVEIASLIMNKAGEHDYDPDVPERLAEEIDGSLARAQSVIRTLELLGKAGALDAVPAAPPPRPGD